MGETGEIQVPKAPLAEPKRALGFGDASFRAFRIAFPTAHIARVQATSRAWRLVIWVSLAFPCIAAFVLHSLANAPLWGWGTAIPFVVCIPLGVVIAAGMRRRRVVFDWDARQFFMSGQRLGRLDERGGTPLKEIRAVQICAERSQLPTGPRAGTAVMFQLNLVLARHPEGRICLFSHADEKGIREDAAKLAEFLHVPLLDHTAAVESAASAAPAAVETPRPARAVPVLSQPAAAAPAEEEPEEDEEEEEEEEEKPAPPRPAPISEPGLPEAARKAIEEARATGATILHLDGMKLTEIPKAVFGMTQLRRLNLSYNQITSVPDDIARLTYLVILDLSGNKLESLPEAVGALPQLSTLHLTHNQLRSLPRSLLHHRRLRTLRLEGNPGLGLDDRQTGMGRAREVLGQYFDPVRRKERTVEEGIPPDEKRYETQEGPRDSGRPIHRKDEGRRRTSCGGCFAACVIVAACLAGLGYYRWHASRPPLYHTIARGDTISVERLIDAGASVASFGEDFDSTPLHLAAHYGHWRVVEILLQRGASVDARDRDGQTPLHLAPAYTPRGWAVESSFPSRNKLAIMLLAKGADVNAVDRNGMTPLHNAAGASNRELAAILLEYGANPTVRDNAGFTPFQHAGGRADIIDLLMEAARKQATPVSEPGGQ